MAVTADQSVAFSKPGGERCVPSQGRPVDLVHLAKQTMGDRALEQEVLGLFVQQLLSSRERLASADETERRMIAHTLKGSASGIGAFAIAECAARIENAPSDPQLLVTLSSLIDDAHDFIAAINR